MRRYISQECKDIALHMLLNEGVSDKNIRRYNGISERAMKRLHRTFHKTGESVRKPLCAGRPRVLDSLDACVSPSLTCTMII